MPDKSTNYNTDTVLRSPETYSIPRLEHVLRAHHVPLDEWGKGDAKTLQHLQKEIESGESILEFTDAGVVKITLGSCINIFHRVGDIRLKLVEDRQVFKDGREKKRNLSTSIGEKRSPDENPLDCAYRALEEELGISERLPLTDCGPNNSGLVPSVSFPGISTRHFLDIYELELPDHLYKPEGYIEEQEDKTNYFVWMPAP